MLGDLGPRQLVVSGGVGSSLGGETSSARSDGESPSPERPASCAEACALSRTYTLHLQVHAVLTKGSDRQVETVEAEKA